MQKINQIKLLYNHGFKWYSSDRVYVKGYFWDEHGDFYQKDNLIGFIEKLLSSGDFDEKVKLLNGCYSIIVKDGDKVTIATDLTRSFPIFYCNSKGNLLISDSADQLACDINAKINDIHLEEFLKVGYVFSNGTLHKNIFSTRANSITAFDGVDCKYDDIVKLSVTNKQVTDEILLKNIDDKFFRIANQLIQSAAGRTIVVPLSGGLDSRAIVAILYKNKYKNVICYTYGKINNEEYKISKYVAEKLNYQHIFIEYSDNIWTKVFSDENMMFFKYACNGVSLPHYQDIYAFVKLHERNLIPRDSIIVPGHSGDLIGGSHLRTEYYKYILKDEKYLNNRNIIISKHIESDYSYEDEINSRIDDELKISAQRHYFPTEYWNVINRQAKYINNSVRIYEFYGYEFRLPLWDVDLTKYFLEMCPSNRTKNILYNNYLFQLFGELGIDVYMKNDNSYRKYLYPIFKYMPVKIKILIKSFYVQYTLKKKDHNNFSAANKLLLCNAASFKELQKGFAKWLYEKLKKNWCI